MVASERAKWMLVARRKFTLNVEAGTDGCVVRGELMSAD